METGYRQPRTADDPLIIGPPGRKTAKSCKAKCARENLVCLPLVVACPAECARRLDKRNAEFLEEENVWT
jgi:hypothetical protein